MQMVIVRKIKALSFMAAALAVDSTADVHQVDVKSLQQRLQNFGAYLPNA
jgi:hypothetical protein